MVSPVYKTKILGTALRCRTGVYNIVLYVAPDRPEAAQRLGLALIEKTKVLGGLPLSGRVVPEFDDPLIRELILKPYRIVYRVDEAAKVVGVARYWRGARSSFDFEDIKP